MRWTSSFFMFILATWLATFLFVMTIGFLVMFKQFQWFFLVTLFGAFINTRLSYVEYRNWKRGL